MVTKYYSPIVFKTVSPLNVLVRRDLFVPLLAAWNALLGHVEKVQLSQYMWMNFDGVFARMVNYLLTL